MRWATGFIVAFAVTVLAFGTSPAMQSEPWTMGGASSANCGCPIIQSVRVTPVSTIEPEVNYTLAGHAVFGWGFSNASITKPGPDITVYLGDVVTLTLVGNDNNTPHNWFVDYNDDNQPSPGEPSSRSFNEPSGPKVIVWNFTADRPGRWTYRCLYHPTSMIGTFEVLPEGRPVDGTLVGNAIRGWGETNSTIENPGPEIIVGVGAVVTLTLVGNDNNTPHNWFVDYNNDNQPSPGEPSSPDFNAQGGPKVIVWNFTADRPGQYTYRCLYHPTSMTGTIIILGEERRPPGGPAVGLIPGILLISLGGVLVIAVIYHVRAVRAAKRGR